MATLKDLIDARLLAPGPIVFKYKGDTHAGELRDDGKIKVGQHVFEKPGNWGSHLYPSVKLNGFHQLYTPLGTKIQKLRNQLKAQNQLPPEPPGDEDVHEDEAPVEAPQQRQQPSTGGRKRQQTNRLVNMEDDGKTYVVRDDEEQPAPKKSRPAEDSSSSDDDVNVAALRAQKNRASSQAVQKPKTQFSVDTTPSIRRGRRHRREQTPCAPSTRRQLDRMGVRPIT